MAAGRPSQPENISLSSPRLSPSPLTPEWTPILNPSSTSPLLSEAPHMVLFGKYMVWYMAPYEWTPHLNLSPYGPFWKGYGLIYVSLTSHTRTNPQSYTWTPHLHLLTRSGYFKQMLARKFFENWCKTRAKWKEKAIVADREAIVGLYPQIVK